MMTAYEEPSLQEPGAELELFARRELALQAVDAITEVLEVDVTVGALMQLSSAQESTVVRLAAKRALRCVEAIGRPDSEVVRRVGQANIYHYVEGVIEFGASERTYLQLMDTFGLCAEEVTALYALRRGIMEETNGVMPSFPRLLRALTTVGFSPQEAAADTDGALTALSEGGFFVNYFGGITYDRPQFSPHLAGQQVPITHSVDSTVSSPELFTWLRQKFERLPREDSEE
ncbi:MAG TPA: hypothetical protein VJP80_02025 [Candidatus Saccharimonadales bacterium]|nr:hypothetical protein [Candidatus Saccharimonadales bacterium]